MRREADEFLSELTERLMGLSYSTIKAWPEWPATPVVDLMVPKTLHKYHFGLMKDTQADQSIRVAVQRYRSYLLGIGEMTADGFFIYPDGAVRRFEERDVWEVT